MAFLAKSKTVVQQIYAYNRLHRFLRSYQNTAILDFDENAANVLNQLRSQKIRIGTMDLKIASIAVSRNAILVSRNLRDFEAVPNLIVKDWTI